MEKLEKSEVEPEKFNIESHDPESSHMSDYSSVLHVVIYLLMIALVE